MENKKAEKSQAELYREERKKRMAAAAKKNAKKSPQLQKAKHIAGKVIGIVIAVALVLGAVYAVLNFFGVPQRVITVAKVGDERISIAKYKIYYMDIYMNLSQQSKQYDSTYGEGYGAMYTGYDASKSPMEQAYTLGTLEGFDGENPTWADYIRINALNYMQSYVAYANLAREAGMTLSEDEQKEIDDEIEQLRSTAESNDYSLNRFLVVQYYGNGVNEKLLREVMEERQLASDYAQQKQQELSDAITDEQVETEYNENLADYALVSVSAFTVTADTSSVADDATDEEKEAAQTEAMAKAKTLAEGYAAKVTSPETLLEQAKINNSSATEDSVTYTDVTPSTLTSYFGQAACDWVVSADRAVGNVTVVESDNGYTVIYLSALPHKDTVKPVDVRHILIAFPTDDDGNVEDLTDEQKQEYYDKAKSVYDQYLANPTEDNFATLASANSEDPGSKDNGGLYEEVNVGDMVDAFNDWCFDASRKPGDTGIIETEYGYHVMYYVGNDHDEAWKTSVKTTLANEAFNTFDTETLQGDTYKLSESNVMLNWAASQLESLITKQFISY